MKRGIYRLEWIEQDKGFGLFHNFHLEYLAIHPLHQGQGLAKRYLLSLLQRWGRLSLDCEQSLIPFYLKLGFQLRSHPLIYQGVRLYLMSYGHLDSRGIDNYEGENNTDKVFSNIKLLRSYYYHSFIYDKRLDECP